MAIILLGPPGAGKGTQARKLSSHFNYARVSTGDMLREAVRKRTTLGKKAQRYMEAGDLVPDELVDAIVKSRLARRDCEHGFVLDGYPRTIPQAGFLEGLLAGEKATILAIGIRVRNQVLQERVAGRWTCPNCGKIFSQESLPSLNRNRCDECGASLALRKDDSTRVVEDRLQVYRNMTEPLVHYYRDRRCYHEVDGERSVEDTFETLKAIVEQQVQDRHARAL